MSSTPEHSINVSLPWSERQRQLTNLISWARGLTPTQLARLSESDRAQIATALEQYELQDPVTFAQRILGMEPWHKQAEVMRAINDHDRVAVRSGHKIGKSACAAALALWWYYTRPRATVVLTSTTDDQVGKILWAELTRLYNRAPEILGGEMHESHRAGLRNKDGRRIFGLASNKGEGMAGFSGEELLFVMDEASGIEDYIFDAIEGNRAGGARVIMFGNPTQQSGRFYEAFHDERGFWHCIHISSETTPNVTEGRIVVPGLATRDYIEEKRAEWGENSPLYMIRVRGDFPDRAADAVIDLDLVKKYFIDWREPRPSDGRLEIGVDVARFGEDVTVIQPRRGLYADRPVTLYGADIVRVTDLVARTARKLRVPGERPIIRIDGGGVGGGVVDLLRAATDLEIVDANASASAGGEEHARLRDKLWFNLRDWLKEGGKAPQDRFLSQELAAPVYSFDLRGRIKVESKDDIRNKLHPKRSPDRADALALAVFQRSMPAAAKYDSPLYIAEAPDPDELAIQRRIDEISEGWR
jgi:phage terminase large subunit